MMCGILAAFKLNSCLTNEEINFFDTARDQMANRGPDSFGTYATDNIYLGHRRLAIQDLSSVGSQPAVTPCGRYTFIFNGEIYNHFELRKLLTPDQQQIISTSSSDTLTLSYLLSNFSIDDILPRLSGMFVFVVVDIKSNLVHVCRDKFGEKPCFIARKRIFDSNFLLFSSSLSAFSQLSFTPDEINYPAVYHYLGFQSSPSCSTIFKSVHKQLPGTRSTYSTLNLQLLNSYTYWNVFDASTNFKHSEFDFISSSSSQLCNTVDRRMDKGTSEQRDF